jgi:hypothetical protein
LLSLTEATQAVMYLLKDKTLNSEVRLKVAFHISQETISTEFIQSLIELSKEMRTNSLGAWRIAGLLNSLGKGEEAIDVLYNLAQNNSVIPWVQIRSARVLAKLKMYNNVVSILQNKNIKYQISHYIFSQLSKSKFDIEMINELIKIGMDSKISSNIRLKASLKLQIHGYLDQAVLIWSELVQDRDATLLTRVKAITLISKSNHFPIIDKLAILEILSDKRISSIGLWQITNTLQRSSQFSESIQILEALVSDKKDVPWVLERANKFLNNLIDDNKK